MKHRRVNCSIGLLRQWLMLSVKDLRLIFPLSVSKSNVGWTVESFVKPVICSQQEVKSVLNSVRQIDGYWLLWKPAIMPLSKQFDPTPGYLLAVAFGLKPFQPSTWKNSLLFLPLTTLEGRTRHAELIMSDTDSPPIEVIYSKDILYPTQKIRPQLMYSHLQKMLSR